MQEILIDILDTVIQNKVVENSSYYFPLLELLVVKTSKSFIAFIEKDFQFSDFFINKLVKFFNLLEDNLVRIITIEFLNKVAVIFKNHSNQDL